MSGALGDLTTLARVKAWRNPVIGSNADDPALQEEITEASRAILNAIQRESLSAATYVETRNGDCTTGMMLYNFPIIDVSSVVIGQCVVPIPTNPNTNGFVFDQRKGMLYLRGYVFDDGYQNVLVTYRAGYMVKAAPFTIPATPFQIACTSLAQFWGSDQGVVAASGGGTFEAVASAPGAGQYVAPLGPDGFYQFNAADEGTAILIDYGYVPRDVVEAATQTVILEYNRRGRIGENSKVLAGENVTYYTSAAFTKTIESRLRNYVAVVPIE